jgi:glycosyltransferase involved in cell wall biosynthesis
MSQIARASAATIGLGGRLAIGPSAALLAKARTLPADLTIVHNEPAHWAGIRLMAAGRRVAADIEDWYSEDLMPEARAGRPLRLIRSMEATLLRRSAYVTTTSRALSEALHGRYGGPLPRVVSNSFPLQPNPLGRTTGPVPAFFWFSQTTGPGRGLELFLAAWSRTTLPSRLVLLGDPVAGYAASLLARVPADRRDRVVFRSQVPPASLPAVIAEHDIGLALEQSFIVNRDLTVTNKILQYLNAGLAVVASPTAGQREVLAQAPDAGIVADFMQTSGTASALDRLLAERTALAGHRAAARRLAEDVYCWEREEPRLLDLVGTTLAG